MSPVSLKHRLLYGLGYMGVLVTGVVFTTFATYYYIQHVKLNPAWVGIGFGIVSAWEAVISPFIGYISDRTQTRWGRRVPYVVLGIPLMAVFLWLVFNPAFDATQPVLAMAWFMTTLFMLDSIFMIVDVNWQAVNAEMNVDLATRSQQGAIVGVLSMLGVAIAVSATLPLAESLGWSNTTILIALLSAAVGYMGVGGLKENPKLSQPKALGLKDAIGFTLGFRPSLFYMGLATILKIAMFSVSTMIPLFAVWVLAVPESQSGLLLLASSGGMLVCFPLAAALVSRIGPRKAMMAGFVVVIAASSLLLLMPLGSFPVVVAIFAASAAGFTLLMLGAMVMLSDVIDADAVQVGRRREGIYNSAYAFVQRVGAFAFSVLMGIVLNLTGFNSAMSTQSPLALSGIRGLLAGVPLGVSILGLVLVGKYPMTDVQAKAIRDQAIKQREEFVRAGERLATQPHDAV